MLVVNTETVPGYRVLAIKGLVQGSTVRAKHLGRDIAAGFKNLVGGELKGYTELLTEANAESLFRAHELVIDATDGVETKFLLSDTSVRTGTPLIYAGVLRFEGLAMRIEPGGPCLRCLFESPPDDAPTCAQAGVLGSMAGLMGGLQATLALQSPAPRAGEAMLQVIDGRSLTFRAVKVRRRADCAACGARVQAPHA